MNIQAKKHESYASKKKRELEQIFSFTHKKPKCTKPEFHLRSLQTFAIIFTNDQSLKNTVLVPLSSVNFSQ